MELWKKQKKILAGFGIFMAFMFLCTLISKAVYASGLPQVTVDTPRRMAISHKVEAEGIVHQGREYAINVLSGLRVRTVYIHVGDRVTPETLLFELDTEDLKEKIQEQELAIKKLQLQIADMEQNRNLDSQKKAEESARAQEDYTRAENAAQESLNRAEDDLDDAEDAYESHKENAVSVTSEENRKKAQAAYEEWVKKEAELKAALEAAKKAYEDAQKNAQENTQEDAQEDAQEEASAKSAYETAAAAYQEHIDNPVPKPDFSAEDAEQSAWQEKKDSLKDAVEAAERAVEDAEHAKSDAMLEAGRKVTDAKAEEESDSSLEINKLELSSMQSDLTSYKKILEAAGQVYPEAEGMITRIQVSPGERVPDGAAVVYADLSSPMQFSVSLTKEQKKYVNQGDTIELSLGGSSGQEYTVDYVAENEVNPELYDAYIFLPDGVGTIGQSGILEAEKQSETFSCCIPIDALREDANHRNYVYTVSEKSGILGKELAAEKIYVKVLDQNDTYAAIEEGVIGSETELIITSTETLEDRDVIRYKEY